VVRGQHADCLLVLVAGDKPSGALLTSHHHLPFIYR
jgi:hypothetical protein